MKPANLKMADPWPTELVSREQGRVLTIHFDTGEAFDLDAEYLRVESPSAEVKGHGPGQEQLVSGKRHVSMSRLEPVGSYAVRIVFSDGHSTGLFTWNYLAKLGREHGKIWSGYLKKLSDAGKTRG
jgi:DUF971 family protein